MPFSNHGAKRDQYSPQIIGTDSRSLQNWLNFRLGICGHPSIAACECASVGGVGTSSHPEHGVFDSMMMQDYAEQQTIPAALLRASVFTPQSA
jgi:hypothetical protein